MLSKNQTKEIRQLEQRKHRRQQQQFVAEGPKVVADLLQAGFTPRQLLATADWQHPLQAEAQHVSDDELRRVSFLQHPQQVLAVFDIPQRPTLPTPSQQRWMLALDGVQDPGNLGTIVRLADWFGIDDIVCSEDTADVWNPKVVQATMGSIARVAVHYTPLPAYLEQARCPVVGTVLDGDNIYRTALPKDGIIVMGNEGKGISLPVRQQLTQRLLIPPFRQGPNRPESLNVAIATAIACAELMRPDGQFSTRFACSSPEKPLPLPEQ